MSMQELFEEHTLNATVTNKAQNGTIPFHIVFQIIEVCVCLFLVVFFGYQRHRGHCGWEVLYVSCVTPIGYILTMSLPTEFSTLELVNGQQFFWFRYAGWLATCPIMLELLCRVVVPRKPSTDLLMRILICDLLLIISGVTSALMKNLIFKFIAYTSGGFMQLVIYFTIFRVWQLSNDSKRGIPKRQSNYRRNIMVFTFITWLIFPILFMLGPETFNVISLEWSIVGHVIGDLLSKNMYTFMSWHFRNVFMKNKKNLSHHGSTVTSVTGSASTLGSETTADFDNFSMSMLSGLGGRKKKREAKKAKKRQTQQEVLATNNKALAHPPQSLPAQHQQRARSNSRNSNGKQGQEWRHAPQMNDQATDSETDISDWNMNQGVVDPLTAHEKSGMRSEWESNLSLAQEASVPPQRPAHGPRHSRSNSRTYQGNDGFLENL